MTIHVRPISVLARPSCGGLPARCRMKVCITSHLHHTATSRDCTPPDFGPGSESEASERTRQICPSLV